MIRRVLLVLLIPLVWVPLLAFLALAIPALPWWSWVFAVVFWVLLIRRRRAGAADSGLAVEGGVAWSPTRRSGGAVVIGYESTKSGARVAVPFAAADVRARERRNGFAIHGYTGANGGGKTMAACFDALPSLAAGRPIVSTCRILDPRTGEPHPLWVPLDDFRVLLEVEDCEVILDEVTGVAEARDAMSLPSVVINHFQQLRKADVTVRWTTPNWKRADVAIRGVTQGLTTCVGLMPVEAEQVTRYGTKRRWKQTRLFVWRTYDAKKFDEWSTAKERSSSKQYRVKPVARQVMWGPGSITRDCYDTYEHAIAIGSASDSGTCLHCSLTKRKTYCKCEAGQVVIRPDTPGLIRWRAVDEVRRHLGAAMTGDDLPPHDPRPAGRRVRYDLDGCACPGAAPDCDCQDLPSQLDAGLATSDSPGRHLFPETDDTPGVVVETVPAP